MTHANLQDSLMDFSVQLFKEFAELKPVCNLLISPYSITAALLLVNLGADSTTEEQIRVAVGAGNISKEDVHKQYKELEEKLNAEINGTTSLSIAMRIFIRLGFVVNNMFQREAEEEFGSRVEKLDFINEPDQSRLHINEWVEQQTKNKIQNMLSPWAIGQMTSMILVNAIYFEGEWSQPFNGSLTKKSDFYVMDKTVKVEMMSGKERVKYLEDESGAYSVVELSYKDCNIVMDIILPTAKDGLSRMENILNLSFMKQLSHKLKSAERPEVILGIPKFKLEDQYNLEYIFRQKKITHMFLPDAANFSPMLKPDTGAFISAVKHRSLIEVNEKGTGAVASTDIVMAPGCAPPTEQPKTFIADHPFMFLIRDLSSDAFLFWGRFSTPPP